MKVLVLGGAGYIGSHTVYALIEAGEEVVIIDNLLTGYRAAVHPAATFYKGDIRDRAFLDSVFEKEKDIDAVIHFAASSLAAKYLMDGNGSDVFNLGNGVGFTVREVIDVARKVTGHPVPAGVEDRRAGDPAFLIASSEKARKVLGWDPKFADLSTIISSAWKWHKSHPNGYGQGEKG